MSGVGGGQLSKKNSTGGFLTKNSVIKCSIDELELDEGLIVVSFAHKDNLYQGVLLQLNRERGIPVGISFPKDYFSEDTKTLEQQAPNSVQAPPPPPPLVQRNTYFQETDNGRQYRSLRRVIKTPARFKNSRMSLRPVQRPVLCAKCGALCSEKDKDNAANGGAAGGQSCNSANEETESKPKKNGDSHSPKKSLLAVTATGNNKSKDIKSKLELNPKVRLSKLPPPKDSNKISVEEDPTQDYNYQGVGTVGVVDNVWKRPLNKPLKYQTRHAVNSAKPLAARLIKPPRKIVSKNSEANNNLTAPTSASSMCPVFRIASDKSRKANNLKLCIKRLTMAAEEAKLEETKPGALETIMTVVSSTSSAAVVPPIKIPIRTATQKIKLKRRNSTMPFRRFYDRSKNSPTWRTRKISTMSNPDDKLGDLEEKDVCDSLRLSLKCLKDVDRVDYEIQRCGNGEMDQLKSPTPSYDHLEDDPVQQHPLLSSDLSPIQSPEEFSEDESESRSLSPPINNKPEPPSKTPVIKITFGSSGNGVVVQIPPRNTKNHNHKSSPEEGSDGGDTSELEAKAKSVRKALKKARKEAKRKQSEKPIPPPTNSDCSSLSLCPVLEPTSTMITTTTTPTPLSSSSTKPALTPLTIHLNSGSSSQHYLTSPVRACSPSLNLLTTFSNSGGESTLAAMDSESDWYGKKKKKAKKRKRQKDHKENDHHTGGSAGEIHHNQNFLVADGGTEIITTPGLEYSSSPIFKSEITTNPSQSKLHPHPPTTLLIPVISNGPRSLKQQLLGIPPPPPLIPNPNNLISPTSLCADGVELPNTANNPKRVCISLKRLKDQSNAYVPWNNSSTINSSLSSSDEHNGTASASDSAAEAENEEPHEFQDITFHQSDESLDPDNSSHGMAMESIETYNHVQSNHEYKKGDVVWGKSTGCPWWPGKIVDIQLREGGGVEDARAKIAWYKSASQSCIAFIDLHPFEEYFETKYTKNRKRGCYQQAVREAMVDAHPINLQDFPTD